MTNYRNHRRFIIKCLKPVSVRLKDNVPTARGLQIIIKAEKQLLNESIRLIYNMLEVYMYKRETYFYQLRGILDHNTLEECQILIKRVIECRHQRVLEQQKFEALHQWKTSGHSKKGGCSNHATNTGNEK